MNFIRIVYFVVVFTYNFIFSIVNVAVDMFTFVNSKHIDGVIMRQQQLVLSPQKIMPKNNNNNKYWQ